LEEVLAMECSLGKGAYWRSLLVSASLVVPGAALAADNGFYLGLAAAEVSSDYDLGPAAVSGADDDRGFKGIVGFRPLDAFAIEANYVDFGETRVPLAGLVCVTTPCPTEAQIDSQAVSVSAVGLFALPLVDLFARVGYARWESEQSLFSPERREGSDPTYGAGAQVRLGSFALRLEYERFDFDDDSAELVSVGFTYTFL
jgi:OmpA-OmpF porin, OOP family